MRVPEATRPGTTRRGIAAPTPNGGFTSADSVGEERSAMQSRQNVPDSIGTLQLVHLMAHQGSAAAHGHSARLPVAEDVRVVNSSAVKADARPPE
jgi:hypothetical protein